MASSGLTALDLVLLHHHEGVAALPSDVVRAIRRFAATPLLPKLKRAMNNTLDSIAPMEQLVVAHNEDVRLDMLDGQCCGCCHIDRDDDTGDWQAVLAHDDLVNKIFKHGAQHASALIVDYAMATCPELRANGALWLAVSQGRLAAVQLLHPRVADFGVRGYCEGVLLNMALHHGRLEIVEWIYTHRRDPRATFHSSVSEDAASSGDLAVLKWIYGHCEGRQWSRCVLEKAAVHDHQHVMDWIHQAQVDGDVELAMEAVAMHNNVDVLVWLHEKYPESKLSLSKMEQMAATSYRVEIAMRLIVDFPERYTAVTVKTNTNLAARGGDASSE